MTILQVSSVNASDHSAPHTAVLGAGIAGLTAAYVLQQQEYPVSVFEAANRPGGVIRSESIDGYLVEHGPNTIQTSTPLLTSYIERLGLEECRCWADDAANKRYVVRDGTPQALPTSPPALLKTSLFSGRAKLRVLWEPFVPPAPAHTEESVAAFTKRRLGPEILDYGINPFVAGIFAGDPEQLSLPHAFPTLHTLEQEHGSVIGGMFKRMRARRAEPGAPRPQRRSFSFRDGLQMLPGALARALGDAVRLDTPVAKIQPADDGWLITTDDQPPRRFDAVLSTLPLYQLVDVLEVADADLSPLRHTYYPPVSVMALGFRREDVRHPLDGFGMLVPGAETDFDILGTLFSSTLFPDRAPEGHVLLTTLLGGARHPELALASEERREQVVRRDLRTLLGVTGTPALVHHICWSQAIPQYNVGYGTVKTLLAALEQRYPTLAFAGNYRSGVSVGDALASGDAAARQLVQTLSPAETSSG